MGGSRLLARAHAATAHSAGGVMTRRPATVTPAIIGPLRREPRPLH